MQQEITGVESITFGITTVVQIVVFIGGLFTIYYTMKGRVDKIDQCIKGYVKQNDADKKKLESELDSLEKKVDENNSEVIQKIGDIKDLIHKNHIDLLTAISQRK